MKKYVKLVPCILFAALSGSAFARPNLGNSALEAVIAGTDAQLAPALSSALEQYQPAPVPAAEPEKAAQVRLTDITEKCTHNGEVVSAYPAIYKMVPSEENSRVIKVFSFRDAKGVERRLEVFYTGGDWMQYGLTYFVTDAGQERAQAGAYFMTDLSTSDREEGAVAPKVDPFNMPQLTGFIVAEFLDAAGKVKAAFGSVAIASAK
ncbi:MAG: hypothetical protein NTY45_16670 [Elusimicrobia bacterium]|nr:hypothetical protein [Elusimicrobiota bacterium]